MIDYKKAWKQLKEMLKDDKENMACVKNQEKWEAYSNVLEAMELYEKLWERTLEI